MPVKTNSTFSDTEVTVVIPTFRRPDMLIRAVESALQQTVPVEVIVTDDAADPAVARMLRDRTPQVTYIGRRSVNPITDNWAFALSRASMGLIALLEDDNYWTPDHLRHAVDTLMTCEASLYHSAHREVHVADDGTHSVRHVRARWANSPDDISMPGAATVALDALTGGSINASTVVLRADVLERVPGFDARYPMGMDTLMWARIAAVGGVCYKDVETVIYTYHGDNASTIYKRNGVARRQVRDSRRLLLAESWRSGLLSVEAVLNFIGNASPSEYEFAAPIIGPYGCVNPSIRRALLARLSKHPPETGSMRLAKRTKGLSLLMQPHIDWMAEQFSRRGSQP